MRYIVVTELYCVHKSIMMRWLPDQHPLDDTSLLKSLLKYNFMNSNM